MLQQQPYRIVPYRYSWPDTFQIHQLSINYSNLPSCNLCHLQPECALVTLVMQYWYSCMGGHASTVVVLSAILQSVSCISSAGMSGGMHVDAAFTVCTACLHVCKRNQGSPSVLYWPSVCLFDALFSTNALTKMWTAGKQGTTALVASDITDYYFITCAASCVSLVWHCCCMLMSSESASRRLLGQ